MKRLVAASAATLALAACSSSSGPAPQTTAAVTTQAAVTTATTTTSPALTPAQFITKLNALCRAGNKQQRKANQATTKAELAVKVNREIEQLAPPAEDSAAFKRYTTALDRLAGIMSRVADLLNTGTDFSGLSSLLDQVDRSRVQAAIDLGADDCGQV